MNSQPKVFPQNVPYRFLSKRSPNSILKSSTPLLSQKEWKEILEFRFRVHQTTGKFSARSFAEMEDAFDSHSEHLICKINDLIVASVRIVFIDGIKKRSENFSLGAPVPEYLWNERLIEASRGCSDPSIRGTGIFSRLMDFVGQLSSGYGYNFILGNCESDHLHLYERVGFHPTGIVFKAFGKDCSLILWNLQKFPAPYNASPSF